MKFAPTDDVYITATSVGSIYSVSRTTPNDTDIYSNESGYWITSFYASTLACNLLSSGELTQFQGSGYTFIGTLLGLLAYRIWTIERSVGSMRATKNGTMLPILRVLVDAAALYSAALFTTLICFVNANNGQRVVVDMVSLVHDKLGSSRLIFFLKAMPIIFIAFYMVLIRIALRRNSKNMHQVSTAMNTGRTHPVDSEVQDTIYGMKPLQVYVTKFTRDDSISPYHDANQGHESGHHFSMDERESDGATYVG